MKAMEIYSQAIGIEFSFKNINLYKQSTLFKTQYTINIY